MVSALLSLVNPIKDFMFGMLILFAVNFVIGYVADLCNGRKWSWVKAMAFLKHAAVFFVLLASFFAIGHMMHRVDEAVTCVSTVCCITLWLFTVNILKNIKQSMRDKSSPWYRLVNIIHYIVSIRIVERWPLLKNSLIKTEKDEA